MYFRIRKRCPQQEQKTKKKVLVAPLNWGLGHATRCIPIINEFLKQGAQVCIASDGRSLELLKNEFPALSCFPLSGYDIRYPEKGSMVLAMLSSAPKILSAIKKEHLELERIVADHKIDFVFSDNRYGCYSSIVPSVFMTHQLNIMAPLKLKWLEFFIFKMNKKFISKFNACWVPDFDGAQNLSGKLSHPARIKNTKFIGAAFAV